jgi:hypothetical protein
MMDLVRKMFNPKVERIPHEALQAESRLVNSKEWKDIADAYKMKKEIELH